MAGPCNKMIICLMHLCHQDRDSGSIRCRNKVPYEERDAYSKRHEPLELQIALLAISSLFSRAQNEISSLLKQHQMRKAPLLFWSYEKEKEYVYSKTYSKAAMGDIWLYWSFIGRHGHCLSTWLTLAIYVSQLRSPDKFRWCGLTR